MKKRPLGVTITATLAVILGAVLLSGSGSGPILGKEAVPEILVGLYYLATGIGLLKIQAWARWLAMISAVVGMLVPVVLAFFRAFGSQFAGSVGNWLSLGWNGFMIWYFLRPGVKAQFVSKGS